MFALILYSNQHHRVRKFAIYYSSIRTTRQMEARVPFRAQPPFNAVHQCTGQLKYPRGWITITGYVCLVVLSAAKEGGYCTSLHTSSKDH
ncbi:uncharacterized protein BO66DRAFT_51824 [Aspergillus aculeatinus CBS 121060]|uniref:Uncharacterized protein n=1 Tax=Aspergillus aculeatinus CBS 121060 TaxID=1448322 RepID=A0ACD1HDA4_9EURO|nr:hypothetical protein BO66DRAFT_51824 [Aspergillus aculeatinus CBS 121060]RAH71544.1 hypothetical protein BO66DRAFT_51824 [Aspergillus aculeatinus CBS 121060]